MYVCSIHRLKASFFLKVAARNSLKIILLSKFCRIWFCITMWITCIVKLFLKEIMCFGLVCSVCFHFLKTFFTWWNDFTTDYYLYSPKLWTAETFFKWWKVRKSLCDLNSLTCIFTGSQMNFHIFDQRITSVLLLSIELRLLTLCWYSLFGIILT